MTAPLSILNDDHTAKEVHDLANKCKDARQATRLRAIALRLEGRPPGKVADILGTTPQSIRDWTIRYNEGGPDALKGKPPPGRPRKVPDEAREAVASWLGQGPSIEADGVNRWRLRDLAARIFNAFGISLCLASVWNLVKSLKYSWIVPRPRHPKADERKQRESRRISRRSSSRRFPRERIRTTSGSGCRTSRVSASTG